MVNHPSNRHTIKQPDHVALTRIRFLPEWLSRDFPVIVESPDLLSLFFTQSWFQYPTDTTLHVFSIREDLLPAVDSEFGTIERLLRENRGRESICRISLLKLMLLLGDEYHVYWRGGNRLDLRDEVLVSLQFIEDEIFTGKSLRLKELESVTGMTQDHLGRVFRKATGVTLVDYAQRRRIHQAAFRLLTGDQTAKDISEVLGFTDSAHFSKSFQKYFGVSPNVYRQKFGQLAEQSES